MGSGPVRPADKLWPVKGGRENDPRFPPKSAAAGADRWTMRRLFGASRAPSSKPDAQQMRDLPDDAAPEQQDANHEDDALDHGHPFADAGEIILHPNDDDRAGDRPEHGAETADQRHQHDLA